MKANGEAIRRAEPQEAESLSALAIASKRVWRYSDEQMAVFAKELSLTPRDLEEAYVFGTPTRGFYSLGWRADGRLELDHLFVAPNHLGQGVGAALLCHARERARQLGARELVVQSDPHAEGFYLRHGARLLEQIPSSIPGRTLPFLALRLPGAALVGDAEGRAYALSDRSEDLSRGEGTAMPGFLIRWGICALALWVASEIVPGLRIDDVRTLILAAILLGFVNAIIRPIAVLLTLPLTVVTLGLFLLVVNAGMLGLVAAILSGFHISGFLSAVLGSIVVSTVSWLASRFVGSRERDQAA